MKALLSLVLVIGLTAQTFPVAAQEQTGTPVFFDARGLASPQTAGPLARAITREAIRLAAAGEPRPSAGEAAQQRVKPSQANWSRVGTLASGAEMGVTVKGSRPGTRYLVRADESNLTVLNLTDPALPAAATHVLRDVASRHPEYFGEAQRPSVVEENVRFAEDGVFVADQRVADSNRIVEVVPVTDVVEITARRRHGSRLGAFGGAVGLSVLTWALEANASPSYGVFFASLFGAPVAGAVVGYHAFGHMLEEVIYRAT